MKRLFAVWTLPALILVAGSGLLFVWIARDAAWDIVPRVPGGDGRPDEAVSQAAQGADFEPKFTTGPGEPSDLPGAWPRFRGADFDAIKEPTDVPLATEWPQGGPAVLWTVELGEGFAGPAILNGRVYLMDYDRENQADAIRCLSLDDGAEIWRYSYPVRIKRNHGMSRTVPAVTDEYVVTIGPMGHVTCLDSKSGEFKWMINLEQEYGTKIPLWYAGQCPLIEEGRAILAPAGPEALMIAVDCETGDVVWTCPNPNGYVMTHSSIMPMEFAGRRMYVYPAGSDSKGAVVGVSAADGTLLWEEPRWRVRTNVPAPVVIPPDRVFLSAGYAQYEKGCMMLRLTEAADGAIGTEVVFEYDTRHFGSMQQTPIYYKEHLFGVDMDEALVCMDLEGGIVWKSPTSDKFGFGPYMVAGGRILAMDDEGLLRLIEASTEGYRLLDSADLLDGHDSWAPLALASGRLLVRDMTTMKCVDISQP